jgi:hypothetical protein
MDETLALLSVIPFIGYFFNKLHAWWHAKFHHKCHEEGCSEQGDHTAHIVHDVGPEPETDEDPLEPMWKRCGYENEEQFQEYLKTKPKDEPFK